MSDEKKKGRAEKDGDVSVAPDDHMPSPPDSDEVTTFDNAMPAPPVDHVTTLDNAMPAPPVDHVTTLDNGMPAPPALDLDDFVGIGHVPPGPVVDPDDDWPDEPSP
jgi:hypothetical protein